MKKRFLSILLCMSMMLSLLPSHIATAYDISAEQMKQKFDELWRKEGFRDGDWNNGVVTNANGQVIAETCQGFAIQISDYLFGESCTSWYAHGNVNDLCVGDHVRFRSVGWDHSWTITNIIGDDVFYIDANGSAGANRVGWRKTTRADVAAKINQQLYDTSVHWRRNGYGYIQTQANNWVKTLEPTKKPNPPSSVNLSTTNIATGGVVTATWNKVSNATKYKAELVCSTNSKYNKSVSTSGTKASFTLDGAGDYTIRVSASNSAGSSSAKASGKVTAHNPNTVTFVDYDGTVLNTQSVKYGGNAVAPAAPSREGYTFQGWDKGTQGITKDTTITATYKINVYNVVFQDKDGTVISSQRIEHGSAAQAPTDPTPEAGYVFVGWNYPNFDCVKSNMTITAVYAWGNEDLPIVAEITKAARKTDTSGYDISLTTKNFPNDVTKAKVIVSLKTEENKMVASEMKQIYLNEAENTSHDLFVSYEGVATAAEVEVVGLVDDDKTGVPYSAYDTAEVDLGLTWSNWDVTEPKNPNGDLIIESRTEYRYSDKEKTTSTNSALAGYTLYDTKSEWGGWSGWSRSAVSASSTRQVNTRNIAAKYQKRYTYDRYVSSDGTYSTPWSGVYPNYQSIDIDYQLTNYGDYYGNGNRYGEYVYGGNTYLARMWWHEGSYKKQTSAAYTEYQYRDLKYTYYFYKWGDWSEWSPTEVTATDDRQVETRTTYRYKSKGIKTPIYNYKRYKYINPANNSEIYTYDTTYPDSVDYSGEWEYTESETELPVVATVDEDVKLYNGYKGDSWYSADVNEQGEKKTYITYKTLEDTSGEEYTISGEIAETGDKVDGKQATLLVFKGKNTDPTATQLEAIAQTELDADGKYTFNFKTKEVPTAETGDFILMLGVEGATKPVYIDTIEAPKPEYKVVFVDDGEVISEQTVKEGDTAVALEDMEKEGYTFVGWDTGLSNVHDDLTVTAVYNKNEYSVIFVDWNNNDIAIKTFGYGDVIEVPEPAEIEGYEFVDWKDIVDGETVVTENMIITAEYTPATYTVVFKNWDGTVIKEETKTYGEYVELPETIPEKEGLVFSGWTNSVQLFSIAQDVTLYPMFAYPETTETPYANVTSGMVQEGDTVSLNVDSDNAKIYYAIAPYADAISDNINVEELNYTEYQIPIEINTNTCIVFYAAEEDKNISYYVIEKYTIANPMTSTTVRETSNGYKFQVAFKEDMRNATVIVALYDSRDNLISVNTEECDGVDEYIISADKTGDEAYAKVMVWTGIGTMQPLGMYEYKTITE